MKVDAEYLEYMWPMRRYLVTCGDVGKKSNIIALSFVMPVSKKPPMIAIAVGKKAYSLELIRQIPEFIINVPERNLEKAIYYCGYHSGRDVDKFSQTGLTSKPARSVKPPVIAECTAHMECRVLNEFQTGDKYTIIGEVIEAYADQDIAKGASEPDFACGSFPRKVYGLRFKDG